MLLGGRWAKSMRQCSALSARFGKLRGTDRQSRFHIFFEMRLVLGCKLITKTGLGHLKKMMNLEKIQAYNIPTKRRIAGAINRQLGKMFIDH